MLRLLFPALLGIACGDGDGALQIEAPAKADPYTLVEVRVKGQPADAALVWDVTPEDAASVRELPGGAMVFTGPPGVYKVKVRSITLKDGAAVVRSCRATVTIGTPAPPIPPAPPAPPKPTYDPVAATVRLRHGSSGCTATICAPRRPDGSADILTAAHCTGGVGSVVTITLKDGRSFEARVTARDTEADLSWLRSTRTDLGELPLAKLADALPESGTAVWHQGYGVDRPGNRESGQVDNGVTTSGQLKMTLSVSPGDSGSGIFREDTNELVAVVCCTQSFARKVTMYGGNSVHAARLRP